MAPPAPRGCAAPPLLIEKKFARGPPPGAKNQRTDDESKFRQILTGSDPPPLDVTSDA